MGKKAAAAGDGGPNTIYKVRPIFGSAQPSHPNMLSNAMPMLTHMHVGHVQVCFYHHNTENATPQPRHVCAY